MSITNQVTEDVARSILGEGRVWGPRDYMHLLGYPEEMFAYVPPIPCSAERLESFKAPVMLYYGVPTLPDGKTPLDISVAFKDLFGIAVAVDDQVKQSEYVHQVLNPGWYVSHVGVLEDSSGKDYPDQLALLQSNQQPSSTIEEVLKSIFYFKKTGRYPNRLMFARTRDTIGSDFVSAVGYFGFSTLETLFIIKTGQRQPWLSDRGLGVSEIINQNVIAFPQSDELFLF